jgi:hypothetical protein
MNLLNWSEYMSNHSQFDYRSMSPLRGPDWRWTAAEQMHAQPSLAMPWGDPVIAEASIYLGVLAEHSDEAASQRWPDLAAAHSIYREGSVLRDQLEAWLLTGEPFEVVANKTGIATTTITAYEKYFFNVTNMLNATAIATLRTKKPA